MIEQFLNVVWGPTGIFALVITLLVLFALFALILLASFAKESAKPQDIGEAIYCYFAQSIGIILMSIGGLPTIYSVLTRVPLSSLTYSALLFMFAIGGLVFLWHDHITHHLPQAAKSVPHTVYLFTWKFIGFLLFLLTAISFILNILLDGSLSMGSFLVHLIVAIYGLLLWWSAREFSPATPPFFQHHTSMRLATLTPSKPEKMTKSKRSSRRRK
ncbi:hypothetical protein COU77_02625 [Candidatus Peregrinibacteria bacterium CG10_big_fil_rev_8_21_14_0_10_49_16]|nr:MAG: hypothetical protein COW95_04650 [Candidatus Peregrinibacteria bacterium CG22_combo_CG10-13_8_21_14_all_49_11]PIR51935.1 MAG: hypothetical protein COU77_02625 [Candidatus Peregrinibacteria bacterium CG10_big_fil_rev_8_21_14_0_10_49_16]